MSVHYKFKSAKDYDTVTFDGGFITLAELKATIITQKKLGKNTDFDLNVTNAQTEEEYKDDNTLVPKNTSVIVRRVPTNRANPNVQPIPLKPSATAITTGQPAITSTSVNNAPVDNIVPSESKSEAEKIKDIVNSAGGWHQAPAQRFNRYSTANMTKTNTIATMGFPAEPKIPPPTYICHRCNQPGHFINHCPTNGDPNYDFHKVKKSYWYSSLFFESSARRRCQGHTNDAWWRLCCHDTKFNGV